MRRATMTVARWFGITAGVAGAGHGYYEILQGDRATPGTVFPSIGPPCVPEQAWNACEPAMSLVPNTLASGAISVILGLLILIWAIWFIPRKGGGIVLIVLCVLLLLFGGGFFPPLIGLVGGLAGLSIHKPIGRKHMGRTLRLAAAVWPWPLVVFLVYTFGQIVVGALANDLMQSIMVVGVPSILALLPLSGYSGYGRDVKAALEGT